MIAFCNSNSYGLADDDDRVPRTLPWVFRTAIPGLTGGWPE